VQLGERRVRGKEQRGGGGYWDGVIIVFFCVIRALRC
jgi:hypothetical protein